MKIFKTRKTRLHVFFAPLCNASKNVIKHFVGNKAKGRISTWRLEESKARQIFRKTNISYPQIRTSGGKKCSLFGIFGVLCFLVTSVLRFALLPYYRRFIETSHSGVKENYTWVFLFTQGLGSTNPKLFLCPLTEAYL